MFPLKFFNGRLSFSITAVNRCYDLWLLFEEEPLDELLLLAPDLDLLSSIPAFPFLVLLFPWLVEPFVVAIASKNLLVNV